MKHIVVVGAQHGGAWIAARIKKAFRSSAHVTLLVDKPEIPILPILTHQLAEKIDKPLLGLRNELEHLGVDVHVATPSAHDPVKKVLYIEHGRLSYDVLIVDPIMELDMTPVPGAKQYAFPLDGVKNAERLLRHVDTQMEWTENAHDLDKHAPGTVVIARGDAQGIEAAFALAHRMQSHPAEYRPRIWLCAPELLAAHDEADAMLRAHLMDAGVRCISLHVSKVNPNNVVLADADNKITVDCNTVVWTGFWRQKRSKLCQGPGVRFLHGGAPYWPITGIEEARDAARWVSCYLSGTPFVESKRRERALLKTPGGVLHVGKKVDRSLHHGWRHAWHLKNKLDL